MRNFLFLLVCFGGVGCQSQPPAEFHYVNTSATEAAAGPWSGPETAGLVVRLAGEVDWHFHPEAEEWLTVLEGYGTLYLGPDHAGGVGPEPMRTYPLARGDVYLIPRHTLHSVEGHAQLLLIYSGPNCSVNGGLPETVTW
jgi:mannose-6-phosphate isomerase-like protein (cupin superfamily)